MRLWDTLLADPGGRADCLLRLCIAMLLHVRQELLGVRAPCPAAAKCKTISLAYTLMLHALWWDVHATECHALPPVCKSLQS